MPCMHVRDRQGLRSHMVVFHDPSARRCLRPPCWRGRQGFGRGDCAVIGVGVAESGLTGSLKFRRFVAPGTASSRQRTVEALCWTCRIHVSWQHHTLADCWAGRHSVPPLKDGPMSMHEVQRITGLSDLRCSVYGPGQASHEDPFLGRSFDFAVHL